jgi:hypothetical protein
MGAGIARSSATVLVVDAAGNSYVAGDSLAAEYTAMVLKHER